MTQMSDATHLARTLKIVMDEQEINAAELSRQSGVSMASLSRILSGTVNPSFSNMVKIATALGVGLDNLTNTQSRPDLLTVEGSNQSAAQTEPGTELNLVATFVLQDTDHTPAEAAKLLENAACGSWVSSWTEDYVSTNTRRPQASGARKINANQVEVDLTFPHDMIEDGSLTGMLSVLAAAVTSTGARMVDVRVPEVLLRTFYGPTFGIRGMRDMMNKHGRPLLSTTLRPMNGLSPKMYGRAAYEALKGGVDFTCDPTLLHSIPGLTWRERYRYTAEAIHTAGTETGEYKSHMVNITAGTLEEMIERADWAKELDINTVMVDSAAIGWSALQSISHWCRNNDMILAAMGGRALNGNMMSEQLEAKLLRLAGCDIASIGSPLKGNVVQRRYSIGTIQTMRANQIAAAPEGGILFDQPFAGMESCMPAVGGGHNPWHFPRLLDALGNDTIIQCGGSVMGHPWGSAAGATANRVAVEAIVQARGEGRTLNVDGRNILQRATKYSPELKTALEFWQEGNFLFGVVLGQGGKPASLDAQVHKQTPPQAIIRSIHDEENNKDE